MLFILQCWRCVSVSRMSPRSMTVTSWRTGAPRSPQLHLWPPPPLSSAALRLPLRGASGCLRTPGRLSPSLCSSPRVHRVDRGSRRHRRLRRSLEWGFDWFVSLSVTQCVSFGNLKILNAEVWDWIWFFFFFHFFLSNNDQAAFPSLHPN